jgi:hypothetical protein
VTNEIDRVMNATDGAIVEGCVRREEKRDLGELVGMANHELGIGNAKGVIKIQWVIITAMANTIVKLEKRNLMMDRDYKGRNRR